MPLCAARPKKNGSFVLKGVSSITRLNSKVTDYETLRAYIEQETAGINMEDGLDDE